MIKLAIGITEIRIISTPIFLLLIFMLVYFLKQGRIKIGLFSANRREDPAGFWLLWIKLFLVVLAWLVVNILYSFGYIK